MKNIFFLFATILLASIFTACNDEDDGEILLVIKEIHFTPEGGKTDIDPIVSGSFNISTDKEWIKAKVENGKIIIEVPPFFSGVSRKGEIDISNKSSHKKVEIIQFSHSLKINGNKEIITSIKKGGEYTFSVESTFPDDLSRLRASLKDEADKNWIDAKFTSLSEFAVRVSANPTNKPKEVIVYLIADGDVEATVMDSVIINSTYTADDYIGKWTATFSNKENKVFTEDVEIVKNESGSLYLQGLSIYEDSETLIDIPISAGTSKLIIPTGRMYHLLKEADKRYIFLSTATDNYLMWGQGSGPQEYAGNIEFDSNGKLISKFTPFKFGDYSIEFFAFRVYDSNYPYTSIGITRFIKNLELKMK